MNLKLINISLSEQCNLHCNHCGSLINRRNNKYFSSRNELTKTEFYELITQVKHLGCKMIVFTGGEPFLNRNIWDIIYFTEKLGVPYGFLTNGSLIDEDVQERLKNLKNLTYIRLSLDYSSKERFEKARSYKNGYQKTLNLCKKLNENNIRTGIGMTILNDNLGDIEKIVSISMEYGASFFRAIPVMPIGNYKNNNISKEFYIECVSHLISLKSKYENKYNGTVFLADDLKNEYNSFLFSCPGGSEIVSISAYGNISICPLVDLGLDLPTIKEKLLEQLLNDIIEKRDQFINGLRLKKNYSCSSCNQFSICKGGCIAEVLARDSEVIKNNPSCIKEIWSKMISKVSKRKNVRKIINNLIIDKKILERGDNFLTCYRSLPCWFINLS